MNAFRKSYLEAHDIKSQISNTSKELLHWQITTKIYKNLNKLTCKSFLNETFQRRNQMYFRFQKDLMTGFDPLATRSMVYDSFQVNYIAIST